MDKYFYNRYNAVITSSTYSNPTGFSTPSPPTVYDKNGYVVRYSAPGYSFNSTQGFIPAGTYVSDANYVAGFSYWSSILHYVVIRYEINSITDTTYTASVAMAYCTVTDNYSQGTLITSNIVADDGTYPDNGRHTDGYWYVKGNLVPTGNSFFGMNF
jgi:hypothetical protein